MPRASSASSVLPRRVSRWIWVAIAIVIGAAAILMVGDISERGARLAGFGWWAFGLALMLALGNYAIRFLRWQLYLKIQGVQVPVRSSALVFGAGLSLSITPAKLGELVKSYLLRELHDIPPTRTAPIVVAERVTDLLALLALAVVGVALYGVETTLVLVGAGVVVCGLVLLAWPRPTRWLIHVVTKPRFLGRFRGPMLEIYSGVAGLCRPRLLLTATAIAIPAWGLECLGFAIIVRAFPGAHVDFGMATVIYAATTIAGALSFLPGGLGVTEGGMTILLVRGSAALDHATALDATLLTRIATLWFAVALGLVCLAVARGKSARRKVRER